MSRSFRDCPIRDFINGIPMKLNEKFYPFPRYENPIISSTHVLFPQTVIDDEIDFSAEHAAISIVRQAYEQKLKHLQENLVPSLSNDVIQEKSVTMDLQHSEIAMDQFNVAQRPLAITFPNFRVNNHHEHVQTDLTTSLSSVSTKLSVFIGNGTELTLLEPTPVDNCLQNLSHNNNAHRSQQQANNFATKKPKQDARRLLEEFETCQSSPFDAVELKTLNVFEELREVLRLQLTVQSHATKLVPATDLPLTKTNNGESPASKSSFCVADE